ncbi:MAG: glyoxalase/bleomycin resistance/extradiol dioxygenase family protein [Brevinematales bacterium]|nr:glyoxalase/bleomycin resistance/extradiol dioxygenase family protein [Brevinematales bacterium]
MRIHHTALWTNELERMREFYARFFGAGVSEKYRNPVTGFDSYFLLFDGGTRIEIMMKPGIAEQKDGNAATGYAHIAVSLGDKDAVDRKTAELRDAGYAVIGEPRMTGDGYYEAVIADPDGNKIELTV